MARYIIPSIERFRVSFSTDNGVTLDDCTWEVVYGVGTKRVTINKGVRVDENTVDVYLDTSLLGAGRLLAQLNVEFADSDAPNGTRKKSIEITNNDYLEHGLSH